MPEIPMPHRPDQEGFVSDADWGRHGFVRNEFNRWIPERVARARAANAVQPPYQHDPNAGMIAPGQEINVNWVNANEAALHPAWGQPDIAWHYFRDNNNNKFEDDTMKPIKKKEKKAPKKTEFTEEQKAEAKVRVSIFGLTYPESTPQQWTEYAGIGWSHDQEISRFVDSYRPCFYSKKYFPLNKLSKTVEGNLISADEVKKNGWVKCQHSERWAKPEALVEAHIGNKKIKIARTYIDTGDFFICDLSQKVYHRNSRVQVRNSINYSYVSKEEVAKSDAIKKCEACGHFFEAGIVQERVWGRDRGRVMSCTPCYNREMARDLIRPHNWAEYPAPIHKKASYWRGDGPWSKRSYKQVEDVGIRLFGVEVETEMSRAACMKVGTDRLELARSVKETLGADFVIIKEDGSLSLNGHYADGRYGPNYAGFEIVSAPADIEVHRQRWTLLEGMKNFNVLRAWNTETCGLHVHVSKDALTTLQIGRILMMMTHNNNKKFIAKVAGRGENKYCKAFHKEKFSDGIQYGDAEVRNGVEYIQASFHLPRSDEARRQAVNITNPKTIEFRIFRGTVHPRHIIRNIEFADAVCSFCHPGSRSLKELADWHNLVHYIAENRKAYPLLAEWMESPDVGLLPYRDNAYGPKDTRGTKRPDVVEALLGKAEKAEEDGIPEPPEAPRMRINELRPMRFNAAGLYGGQLAGAGIGAAVAAEAPIDPGLDPAGAARQVIRERRRARRAAQRAADALAPLGIGQPAPAQPQPPEMDDVVPVGLPPIQDDEDDNAEDNNGVW